MGKTQSNELLSLKTILTINSTGRNSAVCLIDRSSQECRSIPDGRRGSPVLSAVINLLARRQLKPEHLIGIAVVSGSGSFTGTKGGIAIANALSWAWRVPAVGITIEDMSSSHKDLVAKFTKRSSSIIVPMLPPPATTLSRL